MRTFLHSMSVFASRSLAESIVDSSRDLFSPGRQDYSRHTFPTSSIANANSVSPPSIASWPRSCSVAKTSCHPSSHVISPLCPTSMTARLTPFHLSLKPPLYKLPVLLHRPRSKVSNLPQESSNTSVPAALSFAVTGSASSQCTSVPPKRFPWPPVLMPHGIVVLDRYYNSLAPYQPPRPNLYGVNVGDFLSFRYVDLTPTASSCVPTRSTTQENSSTWGRMNRPRAVSSDAPVSVFPRYNQRERRYVNFDSIAFGGSSWNR
jgi:hypothetical protein